MTRTSGKKSLADFCYELARWNAAVTGQNVVLLAGTYGFLQGKVGANVLLGLSALTKSTEACLVRAEEGCWHCIKPHLGDAQDQRDQMALSRTIVGIESIGIAVAYNAVTIGIYAFFSAAIHDAAHILMLTLVSLAVGGLVALLPAAYFWQRGHAFARCTSLSARDSDV